MSTWLRDTSKEQSGAPTPWSVYLLYSDSGRRTYVGSTTDPVRRLRQHNGEIVGGARSTSRHRPWRVVMYITGFQNRSVACRWERIIKCRARGLADRTSALRLLARGECPVATGKPNPRKRKYPVPEDLTIVMYHIERS